MAINYTWEKFGKDGAKMIVNEIRDDLLVPWAAKEGLSASIGRSVNYRPHEISFKVTIQIPSAARKNDEWDYNEHKEEYGIKAPYGFTFKDDYGKKLTVSGLNHRATINKILYTLDNGKEAYSSVAYVNHEYRRSQICH